MEINAYNAEKFERNKLRYIIFGTVFSAVFILSILNNNIVGAILLFFLLGGYFYYSVSNSQIIKISLKDEGLLVGTKTYNRNNITGYTLEVDAKSQKIKNIVFLTIKGHSIHTLKDNKENIKNFIVILNDFIPISGEYQQTFLEKMTRKLQL